MKSHIAMLELVRRKAENAGIRAFRGWIGVLATEDEIKRIYAENQFNVSPGRTVHKRQIINWQLIGEAFPMDMDLENDEPFAVFFDIPSVMMPSVEGFLTTHLMDRHKVIERVQWPHLVEQGLMKIEPNEVVEW